MLLPEPLRVARFRAMWSTAIVSQLGAFVQIVATSWVMVALKGSATMVALVQTAANLPIMLFSISAGVLADIFSRRSVMLGAQVGMLVASSVLAVLAATDLLTPISLLAFTFLIGCGMAFHAPAWQASVGELVPREQIPSAIAANIIGNNVARSIGPAIGGWIVLLAGATFAFALNALSYVGIAWVLWRWKPEKPRSLQGSFMEVLVEGFRFGFTDRATRAVFIRALLFSLGAAALWGLMPMFAVRLDGGPDLLGALLGCFGIGAMAGAVLSVKLRNRRGNEAVVHAGILGVLGGSAVLGLTHSVPMALLAHLVAGAGWVSTLSTFNVSIQLATPRELVGRTLAIYQSVTFGALAGGSALWGILADRIGVASAMVVAAVFLLCGHAAGFRMRLPVPRAA